MAYTNYITRKLEKVVSQVTKEYSVILVTGPRQVGKTTMLQKLMEGTNRGYVTLDNLNERSLAKTEPELFLYLHKPPVLIDEAQYAPELSTYIKMHVDRNHEPGAFWLAGSQMFKLMQGVQESLVGRVAVLSLTSLSQAEISGGETEPFTIDLETLSARKANRNVAEIARDADINQTQAKNWLGILETLRIIFYLNPYSDNLLKRLVKTPKLYFYDTGLVCYLTKWSSPETLESGAMNGLSLRIMWLLK
ncbi:MAG: ATP-binding protein [Muribaculaceae bacterium]|nr:ATP-binding protein [Muribaculaceae bacterium]